MSASTHSFTRETLLQRVPGLTVHLAARDEMEIRHQRKVTRCGRHGLALLDVFARPKTLQEALNLLRPQVRGVQDWMELIHTARVFQREGVLLEEGAIAEEQQLDGAGFDNAAIHIAMLNDRTRTQLFLEAIRKVVRPGDVVLDIGTGTGILAAAAAQAGARHVYAVEAGGISKIARQVFAANGLEERVTVIEGWSSEITLPVRADVLVTETLGNKPFSEGILELVRDARKRLLTPEARIIPNLVRMYGVPVAIPRAEWNRWTITPQHTTQWAEWYGVDLSPFAAARPAAQTELLARPSQAREWKPLSEPFLLAEVALGEFEAMPGLVDLQVSAQSTGAAYGVLAYFELELAPGLRLSTNPARADDGCHWRNPVWLFSEPVPLASGKTFRVQFHHAAPAGTEPCRLIPGE